MIALKAIGLGLLLAIAVPALYLLAHVAYMSWAAMQSLPPGESSFSIDGPLRLRPSLLGFVGGVTWVVWRNWTRRTR